MGREDELITVLLSACEGIGDRSLSIDTASPTCNADAMIRVAFCRKVKMEPAAGLPDRTGELVLLGAACLRSVAMPRLSLRDFTRSIIRIRA